MVFEAAWPIFVFFHNRPSRHGSGSAQDAKMGILLRLPAVLAALFCTFYSIGPYSLVAGVKLHISIGGEPTEESGLPSAAGSSGTLEEQERAYGDETEKRRRSLKHRAAELRASVGRRLAGARRKMRGMRTSQTQDLGAPIIGSEYEEGDEEASVGSGNESRTPEKRRSLRLRAAALKASLGARLARAKRRIRSLGKAGANEQKENGETEAEEEPPQKEIRAPFQRRFAIRRKRVSHVYKIQSLLTSHNSL